MSHYLNIKTSIRDCNALVKALMRVPNRLGRPWTKDQIEVHDTPVSLYGYHNDVRPEKANVVIRRHSVGHCSNDIGFVREADGTYRAIISEFDQGQLYNKDWLNKVTAFYGCELAKVEMVKQHLTYVEKVDSLGQPQLIAVQA